MKRREFTTLLGGAVAVACWSSAGRGQGQSKRPPVVWFRSGTTAAVGTWVGFLRKGLAELGYTDGRDLERFLDEMRELLRKFSLTLHPEKTLLIEFGRFAVERRKRRGLGKPETFAFLGFTFICGKTQTGKFQIKRKTRRDRMRAKLKMIKEEMWKRMHRPIPEQGKWLRRVVQGYFNYYAVPTNKHWSYSGITLPTSGGAHCDVAS